MKKILSLTRSLLVLLCAFLLYGCNMAQVGERHFSLNPLDTQWKAMYDKIEGDTHTEKSNNALTTWEMIAVAEVESWNAEKEMVEVANKLWDTFDTDHRKQFVETHQLWRNYLDSQALFITGGPGENGSAQSIYAGSVQEIEIKLRTQLYRDLLAGKNIYKHTLYIY